ncbi:MAG TPA: hypothetical protein VGL61_27400 [Kofleriaceae bacterium]|jgi:hypothetical protein
MKLLGWLFALALLGTCTSDASPDACVMAKNPNCLPACKPDRECPPDTCWDCVAEPGTDNATWQCVDTSVDSCQYGQ